MPDARSCPKGHTLLELLVVAGVVGILVALLLPAVQAAREAARRTECAHHLRQIGLGLQHYHGDHGAFPPGYAAAESRWNGPNWSWSSFLLPYLEQDPLYDALGISRERFGGGAEFAPPTAETQIPLCVFRCPSDAGPPLNHHKGRHATSNYRSVTGCETALWVHFLNLSSRDGVFFLNSHISVDNIPDGSSQTIAVGECMLEYSEEGKRATIWAGMRGTLDDVVYISDAMWWLNSQPAYRLNGSAPQAFSSCHPAGVGFVFADGSVHFLHESIEGRTLERLAGRADGHCVGSL